MSESPLTEEELKKLRALLLADSRRQWLVSSLSGAAKWIAVIIGGWVAFKVGAEEVKVWLTK